MSFRATGCFYSANQCMNLENSSYHITAFVEISAVSAIKKMCGRIGVGI